MKRVSFFLATCLVVLMFGLSHAQPFPTGGEIVLTNPPDSLVYGSSYTFDFALHNTLDNPVDLVCNAVEVYTDNDQGYTVSVDIDKWITGMRDYFNGQQLVSHFDAPGGVGSDTLKYAAFRLSSPGMLPGDSLQTMSFTITFEGPSSGATQFCVDSTFYPPGGEWMWDVSGNRWTPYADWAGTCWDLVEAPCGDLNGDLVINISDILYDIAYMHDDGPPPASFEAADVNCDGSYNIQDLVYTVNYLFNDGAEPCANCP